MSVFHDHGAEHLSYYHQGYQITQGSTHNTIEALSDVVAWDLWYSCAFGSYNNFIIIIFFFKSTRGISRFVTSILHIHVTEKALSNYY